MYITSLYLSFIAVEIIFVQLLKKNKTKRSVYCWCMVLNKIPRTFCFRQPLGNTCITQYHNYNLYNKNHFHTSVRESRLRQVSTSYFVVYILCTKECNLTRWALVRIGSFHWKTRTVEWLCFCYCRVFGSHWFAKLGLDQCVLANMLCV